RTGQSHAPQAHARRSRSGPRAFHRFGMHRASFPMRDGKEKRGRIYRRASALGRVAAGTEEEIPGLRRTFKAFSDGDFRVMWAGAFTSSVGTWMQEVAQNWLILTMTGSTALLGLDAFLGESPFLAFSLFGGVLADRMDRRRILFGSQIVQMT